MFADVRRIQNSIQVTTAAAMSIGEALEDLLGRLLEATDGDEQDDADGDAQGDGGAGAEPDLAEVRVGSRSWPGRRG